MKFSSLLLSFLLIASLCKAYVYADDREISDDNYKFTIVMPSDWTKTDMKETIDKDAISYSFEKNDKKCAVLLLAFKLNTVKNLGDFVYTMEMDRNLNIPQRNGDYADFDNGTFDGRSAVYKDAQFTENIYYYRTKLPDSPFNYVFMLRFITTTTNLTTDLEAQIKKIADSFLPTAK